jgi:hypothetical protein
MKEGITAHSFGLVAESLARRVAIRNAEKAKTAIVQVKA